jgi:hypothetical protein
MSSKIYYRIAKTRYATGDVMKGLGERPLQSTEPSVEDILEQRRPTHCPYRGDSVYMREDRRFSRVGVPFSEGYVHEVEPIGDVYKRDLAWIGILQRRHHKNPHLQRNEHPELSDAEVADKYWAGEASDNACWEYVANEAKVVDVDKDLSPVRPNSPLLDSLTWKSPPAR